MLKGEMMKKKEETKTVKKTVRKKKDPVIQEEVKKPEITYIYHPDDNIYEIAESITGHAYLAGKFLTMNGKNVNTLKEGDVLIWK